VLIAEDLLLLLSDDASTLGERSRLSLGLAGALVLELALFGRVDLATEPPPERLVAVDTSPTGDDVLDEALAVIAATEQPPSHALHLLGERLRDRLLARLVERGLLRQADTAVLGMLPRADWPTMDLTYERELCAAVVDTLIRDTAPSPAPGSLIGLLAALDRVHVAVSPGQFGLTVEQLVARARAVTPDRWAPQRLRSALDAILDSVADAAAATSRTSSHA
jgi:Golgi phosphoprotein 3 (GPP34)